MSPRGGARNGSPGATYSNRSDLQQGSRPLPVSVGPSQGYGQAAAQAAQQKAVPMASGPLPTGPPPGPAAPAAPPMPQGPLPGQLTGLHEPSTNPGEHVMTGAPSGPGAGPEVLNQPVPMAQSANRYATATDFLKSNLQQQSAGNASVAYLLAQMQRRGL